jgi:hypothetical protein
MQMQITFSHLADEWAWLAHRRQQQRRTSGGIRQRFTPPNTRVEDAHFTHQEVLNVDVCLRMLSTASNHTLFFRPYPAFPTTRLAFVVAFSLLPVAPIAHALVLERLLKCAQAALNLVALL